MTSLLDLLPRAEALLTFSPTHRESADLHDKATDLLEDLIGHVLRIEGPPVTPIDGYSEDLRTTIVRSIKGRALCLAHTWTTGPWRCLVLETPSVPMGRPIFLADKERPDAPPRTITDSRSQTFQRRIVNACQQLGIAQPVGEGAVHAVHGSHRTFLAWRPREEDETFNRALRGDSDNLAKNDLDGLQTAGVLPNDRGVFRLTATKEAPAAWEQAPPSLEEYLRHEALTRHGRGEHLETIRVDLRLSKAHMARIFPDYTVGRSIRAPRTAEDLAQVQAQDAAKALQATALILDHKTPYTDARAQAGCSAQALHKALAAALRPVILKAQTPLSKLAGQLQVDVRTAGRLFQGDHDAQKALQRAARAAAHPKGSEGRALAVKALNKAFQDVQAGVPTSLAAFNHSVSESSLRSRITRDKRAAQGVAKSPRTKIRKPTKPAKPRI